MEGSTDFIIFGEIMYSGLFLIQKRSNIGSHNIVDSEKTNKNLFSFLSSPSYFKQLYHLSNSNNLKQLQNNSND